MMALLILYSSLLLFGSYEFGAVALDSSVDTASEEAAFERAANAARRRGKRNKYQLASDDISNDETDDDNEPTVLDYYEEKKLHHKNFSYNEALARLRKVYTDAPHVYPGLHFRAAPFVNRKASSTVESKSSKLQPAPHDDYLLLLAQRELIRDQYCFPMDVS